METIEAAVQEPKRLAEKRDYAWWEVRRLSAWCGFEVSEITPFDKVHERLLAGLFAANSWIAIGMITDLFGTAQRFNVPGAVSDENWSSRLDLPVAEWKDHAPLAAKMRAITTLIRAADRAAK